MSVVEASGSEKRGGKSGRFTDALLKFLASSVGHESSKEKTFWHNQHVRVHHNFLEAYGNLRDWAEEIETLLVRQEPFRFLAPSQRIQAQVRAQFEYMCQAGIVPRDGMSARQLNDLGIRAEPDNLLTGSLRLVVLPEGWRMAPYNEEDPTDPHANWGYIFDKTDARQLVIDYRGCLDGSRLNLMYGPSGGTIKPYNPPEPIPLRAQAL